MKTTNNDRWQVTGDKNRRLTPVANSRHGFTLIELLAVIAIIAILAGFTLYTLGAVQKRQYITRTQAELGQFELAIQNYHDAYGIYPPDNWANGPFVNQLYYELSGTTFSGGTYTTLDGAASITTNALFAAFPGVGGFVNCNKPGAAEDSQKARNFLHELSSSQLVTYTNNNVQITSLIASAGGPDVSFQPLGRPDLNPWRYKSSGTLTNNPGGYELWVQLVFNGKTNLVCNWTKTVQINQPLP